MSGRTIHAPARALFRVAVRTFPSAFRRAHGAEMVEAFDRSLARAMERAGVRAGLRFALRSAGDAVRQGWKERTRGGPPRGHGGGRGPDEGRADRMMRGLATDVRLALRTLRRNPGFTAAATLVLALGIGANTTVFSALRAALLAPPPYPDPERLVFADLTLVRPGASGAETMAWSYPKYRVLAEAEGRMIDPLAGYASRNVTLTEAGPPARINVEVVSPGYFGLLGADPVLGREFTAGEDDASDPPAVAVLSHELWRGRFSGEPSVLGGRVVLNGRALTVVGVAPPGFRGLTATAEAWIPLAAAGQVISPFMVRGAQAHWMRVVGRLREGATFESAREQMRVLGDAVAGAHPLDEPGGEFSGTARRFEDVRVNEGARAAVLLLSVAAGLVLLVACANLSALLLTRARRRAHDGAVRLAMGASRWRLVRASLAESATLAVLGGGVGLALAVWGTRAMAAAWPRQFLGSGDGELRVVSVEALGLDRTVLGFGLAASAATIALFGLAPALRASRSELASRLKDGGSGSRRADRVLGLDARAVLVGAQVALALVLLIGAGLVGGSMRRLLEVDVGFDPRNLLTFQYAIPRESAWQDDLAGFHEAFIEGIERLPGVEGVALGTPPLAGHWSITLVNEIEGQDPIPQGEGPPIGVNIVSPGYFEVLGIRLLRGRFFDSSDGDDAAPTVILDRRAAEKLFPDGEAVGRHVALGISEEGKEPLARVVGVVGDVLYQAPDREAIPEAYYALREFPLSAGSLSVRTSSEPLDLVPAVREALAGMDPSMPLFSISSMDAMAARATGDRRVVLSLLALFAFVTVLLAATGTWGIVSYAVADRRRELALRIALGAGNARIVKSVLGQSLVAGVLGLVAGLGGAWAWGRLLDAFLYRTSPRDPAAFAAGAALLLGVVLLASWLPARRATRVDPVEALKAE